MEKIKYFGQLLIKGALASLALGFFPSEAQAKKLEVLIQDPGFWLSPQEQASPAFALSGTDSTTPSEPLEFFGCRVERIDPVFAENKLQSLTLHFIGKEDEQLSKDDCDLLLRKLITNLNALTMSKPALMEQALETPEQKLMWRSTRTMFLMRYSFRPAVADIPFQIYFLKIEMAPLASTETTQEPLPASPPQPVAESTPPPATPPPNAIVKSTPAPAELPKESGAHGLEDDVFLANIPMVAAANQNEDWKAILQRVLLYYGNKEAADWVSGLAQFGQGDLTTQLETISLNSRALGLRLKPEGKALDTKQAVRFSPTIQQLARSYNQAARRNKMPIIPVLPNESISAVLREMQPELFFAAYSETNGFGSAVTRFQRSIKQQIDNGVPLLWNVLTGLVPEPNAPQGKSWGHPRLIVGYNAQTSEVLYTDSRGAGHELKRISAPKALAMTMAIHAIESSKEVGTRTNPQSQRPISALPGPTQNLTPRIVSSPAAGRP